MPKFRIKLSELRTAVKETLKEYYLQLDPSEAALYNKVKDIPRDTLLSWAGYDSAREWEDDNEQLFSVKALIVSNYEDIEANSKELGEGKRTYKQVIKEDAENSTLKRISIEEAKQLFDKGIFIYIKMAEGKPDSYRNLFVLNNKTFDGSMNIYTQKMTPEEYGFENILRWIEEREEYPLEFYTLYDRTPKIVENKRTYKQSVIKEEYFGGDDDYTDPITSARTAGKHQHPFEDDAIEYVGGKGVWNTLSKHEKNGILDVVMKAWDERHSFKESKKPIKEDEDYGSNLSGDDFEAVQQYDPSSGTKYVFYNGDSDWQNETFRVETDYGIIKNNLSFDEIKDYITKNKTQYSEALSKVDNFEDYKLYQKILDRFFRMSDEDKKDTQKWVKKNKPELYKVLFESKSVIKEEIENTTKYAVGDALTVTDKNNGWYGKTVYVQGVTPKNKGLKQNAYLVGLTKNGNAKYMAQSQLGFKQNNVIKENIDDFNTLVNKHNNLKSTLKKMRGDVDNYTDTQIEKAKNDVINSKENILKKYSSHPTWIKDKEQHSNYLEKRKSL